jgi:hypothetical protein
MKRLASCLALCFLLTAAAIPIAAFDWGGTLDNATRFTYSGEALWYQEDKLALWLETDPGRLLQVVAQGSYTFTIERPYLFDVDLLVLQGEFHLGNERQSVLGFRAGRFPVSDFSCLVLDDNVDGIEGLWRSQRGNLSLMVGYTGLQLAPVSTIEMSWEDVNNSSLLAPPRLIEMLKLELPQLFWRQDLLVSLLLQQDLRSQDDLLQPGPSLEVSGQGGRLSTEYLGVSARGPLARAVYYDLFAYLGTGRTLSYIGGEYSYEWIVSGLFGGSLRIFFEDRLQPLAEVRFILSTGDKDSASFVEGNREGLSTQFVPISEAELALLFSPELGNLALGQFCLSIKPAPVVQTILTGTAFFRTTAGPVSDDRIDPSVSSAYLGSETDLVTRYRPFSDLGLALSAGVFMPGGAFRPEYRELEFRALLEISFSF